MDSGMFLPLQLAAVEALKNTGLWHTRLNEIYTRRREIVFDLLDSMKCRYEKQQTGMFVWANIPERFDNGAELSDYILNEARVFLTPGFIFGSMGNGFLRVSLCADESQLLEGKTRINKLFKN